jgi:hypothetical protein
MQLHRGPQWNQSCMCSTACVLWDCNLHWLRICMEFCTFPVDKTVGLDSPHPSSIHRGGTAHMDLLCDSPSMHILVCDFAHCRLHWCHTSHKGMDSDIPSGCRLESMGTHCHSYSQLKDRIQLSVKSRRPHLIVLSLRSVQLVYGSPTKPCLHVQRARWFCTLHSALTPQV